MLRVQCGIEGEAEAFEWVDKSAYKAGKTFENLTEAQRTLPDRAEAAEKAVEGFGWTAKDAADKAARLERLKVRLEGLGEVKSKLEELRGLIRESITGIDVNLGDNLAGWIEQLDFKKAGAGKLQALGDFIVQSSALTDAQKSEMLANVAAMFSNLQVEMGKMAPGEEAVDLGELLGITPEAAQGKDLTFQLFNLPALNGLIHGRETQSCHFKDKTARTCRKGIQLYRVRYSRNR